MRSFCSLQPARLTHCSHIFPGVTTTSCVTLTVIPWRKLVWDQTRALTGNLHRHRKRADVRHTSNSAQSSGYLAGSNGMAISGSENRKDVNAFSLYEEPPQVARAIVIFITTRDRIPSPPALQCIIKCLRLSSGYSVAWFLIQHLARTKEHAASALLAPFLLPESVWHNCLRVRGAEYVNHASLDAWAWILTAPNWDARIKRFCSYPTTFYRPLTLFNILTHEYSVFSKRSTLIQLISYFRKRFCAPNDLETRYGLQHERSPSKFLKLFNGLVTHCLRMFPEQLLTMAGAVKEYMQYMPTRKYTNEEYALKCRVFNHALKIISKPARSVPLEVRTIQWEAQLLLLRMSRLAKPQPLLIGEMGLTAVREVLLGLEHVKDEEMLVRRAKSTSPMYQSLLQGTSPGSAGLHVPSDMLDEQLISRAAKAGMSSREAGFSDTEYHQSLDILAGGDLGSPLTIPTRTLAPHSSILEIDRRTQAEDVVSVCKTQTTTIANASQDALLAARIRTAPDKKNAWRILENASYVRGERPGVAAYAELLNKYKPSSKNSSGSQRPEDDDSPPIREVFTRMIQSGIAPNRSCMLAMIDNAQSIDEALSFLSASKVRSFEAISCHLHDVVSVMLQNKAVRPIDNFSLALYHYSWGIRKIHRTLFNAFINMMCDLQPTYGVGLNFVRARSEMSINYIYIALQLIRLRQGFTSTNRPDLLVPWELVLRRLSRSENLVTSEPMPYRDVSNLLLFIRVFSIFSATYPWDSRKFVYLARVLESVGYSFMTHQPLYGARHMIWRACRTLNRVFDELLSQRKFESKHGRFHGKLSSVILPKSGGILRYLRAMGLLGGQEMRMATTIRWMLTHSVVMSKHAGEAMCAFRAFAEPLLLRSTDEEARQMPHKLRKLAGKRWPSDKKVDEYVLGSKASTARVQQINEGTSWWTQAMNMPPDPAPRYTRRHQSLGAVVRDLRFWKRELAKKSINSISNLTEHTTPQ